MSKKPDKMSSNQMHANGNQVSCDKINKNIYVLGLFITTDKTYCLVF